MGLEDVVLEDTRLGDDGHLRKFARRRTRWQILTEDAIMDSSLKRYHVLTLMTKVEVNGRNRTCLSKLVDGICIERTCLAYFKNIIAKHLKAKALFAKDTIFMKTIGVSAMQRSKE